MRTRALARFTLSDIPFYFKKSFYHAYRSKHTGGKYCYGFKLHIFLHVLFCSVYMIYMYWVFFKLCLSGPVKLSCIWDLWVFAGSSQICGLLRAPTVCGLFAGPCSLHAFPGPRSFCGLLWAPKVCPQFVGFMLCHSFAGS